jgi:hypothetical protein
MKSSAVLVPLLAGMLSFVPTASAAARLACQDAVLRDWSDGRVDGVYAVDCYRAALRDLPEDLRVYSSAADDINRALRARITAARPTPKKSERQLSGRSASPSAQQRSAVPSENDVAAPIPLLALAGVTVLFLAAGISARLARNLRSPRRRS